MFDTLFTFLQSIAPQRGLSRLVHAATRWKFRPWKAALIGIMRRIYQIELSEAVESNPNRYASFNAFFTRALKADARPMPSDPGAVCAPADGVLCGFGTARGDSLLQAKGHYFSVTDLLGGDSQRGSRFAGGQFATIYLSPRDYHRVHMPIDGRLVEMVHIPGRLFSVSASSVRSVPGLFARNERVACLFDTAVGPMAVVLVGAMLVSSIQTVWAGTITPPYAKSVTLTGYSNRNNAPQLHRGEELGRFNMGSTVIVVTAKNALAWSKSLAADRRVKVGSLLGTALDGQRS